MENMWQHPKWPMFAFRELTCCLPSMITNISLSKYPYTSVYHDRQHPESAKMLGVHSDSGTQSTLLQEIGVQHSWLHAQPQLDTCAICLQSMCSTVSSISYILQNYSNHCHCSSNYHGGRGTNDLAEPYIYIYHGTTAPFRLLRSLEPRRSSRVSRFLHSFHPPSAPTWSDHYLKQVKCRNLAMAVHGHHQHDR